MRGWGVILVGEEEEESEGSWGWGEAYRGHFCQIIKKNWEIKVGRTTERLEKQNPIS